MFRPDYQQGVFIVDVEDDGLVAIVRNSQTNKTVRRFTGEKAVEAARRHADTLDLKA